MHNGTSKMPSDACVLVYTSAHCLEYLAGLNSDYVP